MKLHLGCGKRYLKGYVHIDLSGYPHVDHIHDIKTLPMIDDLSVDLIYASHVIEYFRLAEVIDVLGEWRKKLKPGGILRLAVPDFENIAKVYQKYGSLDLITGLLYGHWRVNEHMWISHKTVYDFNKLKDLLESVGFRRIKRWDWRKVFTGKLEGFDDYSQAYIPHLDKENGILVSLNVEGMRI